MKYIEPVVYLDFVVRSDRYNLIIGVISNALRKLSVMRKHKFVFCSVYNLYNVQNNPNMARLSNTKNLILKRNLILIHFIDTENINRKSLWRQK